jgi:phage/plasmid-like protein (TIGR03299 family)
MAHDIWQDNMVYANELPWHGIGKQVEDTIDGEGLKELLNLSPVALRNLYADPMDGSALRLVKDRKAVMRTKENEVIGVVGPDFVPIQDTEIIDTMETLRDEGLCKWETAGLLRNGSRFFAMLKIPNGTLKLKTPNGKEDLVLNFLAVSHGHDGTLAFEFTPTNVRVVCQNTVTMARQEAKHNRVSFYIKHTANAEYRVKAAVEAYKKVIAFNAEVAERAQAMALTPFGAKSITKLVESLFPTPKGKEDNIPAGVLKSRYEVTRLVTEGKGHEELSIAGTEWGAFNAVCEYLDWNRPTRGDKELTYSEKRGKMWEASQFSNQVYDKKLEAMNLIEQISQSA